MPTILPYSQQMFQDLQNLIDVRVAYIAKGGDSNLGLTNRNARLLERVRYSKTKSGGLVTNVYVMKNRLIYLVTCFTVGVIMAAMSPTDLKKCRQSFYGLGNAGMLYPGATPDVQAYLYKCICQPTLTYGLECMSSTAVQMRRLESVQGRLIKQSLVLSKLSHNTALLKTLNI